MKARARPKLNILLEGSLDKAIKRAQFRLVILSSMILITFGAIALKTIHLTFFYKPGSLRKLSESETVDMDAAAAKGEKFRKSIYDRNGILISSNLVTSSLFANPKIMMDEKNAAKQLSAILPELSSKQLEKTFMDKTKSFVWIKRNLHPRQKFEINALGIPGLIFEDEEKRIYPHGRLFAHIVGMVGQDGRGLSGLERFFDNAKNNKLLKEDSINTTLDIRIQSILREEMEKAFEKHKAVSASGVVMDVNTGEILALVSLPDFDPNLPKSLKQNTLFNTVTQGNYELGSVFKPFTFATALENGKINEKMVFDASTPLKIDKFKISDFHAKNRPLSVPEILMYSSNIGTGRIALEVGAAKMQESFHNLHFYDKLDTEITEKSIPTTPKKKWGDITLVTTSYGHGLALSPLHVAAGLSAVVNGGFYNQPTLLKHDSDDQPKPKRIFSQKTSERMRVLLRLVVAGGSGTKANVDGYLVGGKTGTADKVGANGRYAEGKVVSSFIGVFPVYKPQYLVFIVLDDPKATSDTYGFATGGWVAAPFVGNVIARMAPIMHIQPQEDDTKEILARFGITSKYD